MLSIFCSYSAFDEANKVRKPSDLCFGHECKSDFLSNTVARAHVCVCELEMYLSGHFVLKRPCLSPTELNRECILLKVHKELFWFRYTPPQPIRAAGCCFWWAGTYERPFRCALHQIVDFSSKIVTISKFPRVRTLELSNSPGWGRKRRANVPSSVNTATFFIDRRVEECHFKHFNARFFGSINVFLCNNAILIKTSRSDDTSLWF